MKRQWKKWAALLLAAAMCLGLCSCSALDEMREDHAKWSSPDHTTISFRGETYRLLPANGHRINTEYLILNNANLTEANVPVLLSEMFSATDMWYDNDAAYLWIPSDVFTGKQSGMAYAREDKYDEAVALGKEDITADSYFVNYYDVDDEYRPKVEYVEPALFDAVQKILTTVTPSGRTGSCLFVLCPAYQKALLYRPEGDTLEVCRTDSGKLFLQKMVVEEEKEWQSYDIPDEYQVLFEKAVGKYCPYEADFVTEF